MNLIIRVTILFVLVSLIVFLVGGVISFRIMMREVNSEQQHFLNERLNRVIGMIERRKPLDTIKMNKLMIVPLNKTKEETTSFSDTLVMHTQLQRIEPHLKLEAIRNVSGRSYFISLYDVIIEPDDIKDGLVESLVTMYLILLGAVMVIGFISSYFILKPFNSTLLAIRKFSLTEPDQEVNFPKSGIKEFKRLNLFLEEMTAKVRSDYQSLKEFSENASHELQTPIAIIQGKLDVLLDAGKLNEGQITQISSAQSTLQRLKNLSTSLSILTKIENKEFDKISSLNLSSTISEMLEEFRELIDLKSIVLTKDIEEDIIIEMDEVLCGLLLTNLLNNAVRHNWETGKINISLKGELLEVSNSGTDLNVQPGELFQRFKKSNQSSSSLGLGLAIVKKICDLYSFKLEYLQKEEQHTIKISFRN
ncbi:MAG: HAMP domain-containing sensor histidine kinase [Cyclobacteriaceae bacterium]